MAPKRPLAALMIWILGLVLLGVWTALRLPVSSDLTLFLPDAATTEQRVLLDQLYQGAGNRILVASISGGTLQQRTDTSRRLRDQLGGSRHFLRVANGLETLPAAERRILMDYRYLLSPQIEPSRFQPDSLRGSLEQRLEELLAPTSLLTKDLVARDPTGEFLAIAQRLQSGSSPSRRKGVWVTPQGDQALLLLYTRAAGTALDAQQTAHQAARDSFQKARASPDIALELTGPGEFGVESRARIRREARILSVAGSLGVALLLLTLFRSPRILVLAGLPLGAGILVGIWAVWLGFGAVHGITLAFGITLLGVAIDYPLHLLTHIRSGASPRAALNRVWPVLRLGVVTTVAAYLILLTTDFQGLVQLGLFASAGLTAAAAVTRWGLPPLCRGLQAGTAPSPWLVGWLRPSLPLRGLLLLLAAGSAALLALRFPGALEQDLQALSPVPQADQARFAELRTQLGAPELRHALVVTGDSRQQVLARTEALQPKLEALVREGHIDGYRSPTLLLPPKATQRQRQQALPSRDSLARNLDQAAEGLPFREGLFEPFLREVAEARKRPPLQLEDLEGTFLYYRVASLLTSLPEGHAAVLPLTDVSSPDGPGALKKHLDGPAISWVDLKTEADRLVYSFMQAGLGRLAAGIGVLALFLAIGLGSGRRLIGVVTPVSLALVTTLAALVGLGQPITLFHVLALMLVFGIGVDYSLFFSRSESGTDHRERTLRALATCAASTLLVFGVLASSATPVLHQTGLTVALGVAISFLMAMAFGPRLRAP